MPDTGYLITAVAVCTIVTWSLRALPFAALTPLRTSAVVDYLGRYMPVGVMVILAVYTLRDITVPQLWPTTVCLAVTLALHLWRRNAVLGVLAGTAMHVALTTVLAL